MLRLRKRRPPEQEHVLDLGDGKSPERRRADARRAHYEHHEAASLAFSLSRIAHTPHGPTPIGVFRDIERPVYDELMAEQLATSKTERGEGDLASLLRAGDTWTV